MPGEELFLATLALVGGAVLLYPLVRAIADRIRGKVDASLRDEVVAMREDVLAEIQQARREIADLGERMDFAERLLVRQREALPKPGS